MAHADSLGDRMKGYEKCYDIRLPKRSYVYCRLDGQAFHTFTKSLIKPFDYELIDDLIKTTEYLCEKVSNVKFGYVQSDEISLLMADFEDIETEPFFDNKLQKLCSIIASHCSVKFNQLRWTRGYKQEFATFDARLTIIPDPWEVVNMFLWRQRDIERNSLSMLAQAHFSQKTELDGKNKEDMLKMLKEIDIDWHTFPGIVKRGTLVEKREINYKGTLRTKWIGQDAPKLREYLPKIIPTHDPLLINAPQ